jgi:peptide/nickel transport system substrate-binding protein
MRWHRAALFGVLATVLTLIGPASAAKDEWVIGLAEEPQGLSATVTGPTLFVNEHVQNHLYDGLVDFAGPNLALRPMLAERWENPSPTTWRFHLRRGVKFHSGDTLTAEDVKFTVDYQLANKGTSRVYLGPTQGARVIDTHTVEITTEKPFPALLYNLSRFPIMPRAVQKLGVEAYAGRPIGTGPYRFVEWLRGQRIVFEANPDYWGGAPGPKRLVFRPIRDPSTRAAELKAGGVDIIINPPLPQLRDLATGATTVVRVEGGRLVAFPINTLKKPLDDPRVRRAINHAVDRESIVKSLLQGYGTALGQPFSPGWLGYNPELKPYAYDPKKARELLAEAGYPGGFDVDWSISVGALLADKEIAEATAAMLGQVGIRVRLIPTERAKIQKDLQTGSFDGITSGTWGTVAESEQMVGWFFDRPPIFNERIKPTLSRLVAAAAAELDRDRRQKAYQELGRFAHDEALWLFIHAQDELLARRTDIPFQVRNTRGGKAHFLYFIPAGG